MADDTYIGDVVYQDGWHWSLVDGQPGERLFLADDGTYHPAVDGDLSWHDRKHQAFTSVVLEDQSDGVRVTAEELAEIRAMLAERRGG
jgi:hypothetical protein